MQAFHPRHGAGRWAGSLGPHASPPSAGGRLPELRRSPDGGGSGRVVFVWSTRVSVTGIDRDAAVPRRRGRPKVAPEIQRRKSSLRSKRYRARRAEKKVLNNS